MNYKALFGEGFFSGGDGRFPGYSFSKRGFASAGEKFLPFRANRAE